MVSLTSAPFDASTIYMTPLYKTIVIDKTIVILSKNLVILTIKGALVVKTEVSSSPHKISTQNFSGVPKKPTSFICMVRSPSLICCPFTIHHTQKPSVVSTPALKISFPTASLVFPRLMIDSCALAGAKACSINSSADAVLPISATIPKTEDRINEKTNPYDIALNPCLCIFFFDKAMGV